MRPKKQVILEHTLRRPRELIECGTIIDVGPGVRPMQWYKPQRHICVEPYAPYCAVLEAAGYEVLQKTARAALETLLVVGEEAIEAIYLLDVIEHMEKPEAFEVLELAEDLAQKQIIIYTPRGFMEQTEDVWGYGGDYWQTHRSGWLPDEFPGWTIEYSTRYGFTATKRLGQ